MIIEVDRKDLAKLLTSVNPNYSDMSRLEKLGFGQYIGGFCDKWNWNFDKIFDSKLTDEEIYNLYKIVKNKL